MTSPLPTSDLGAAMPPIEVCHLARESRDARFDGLFFTAVRTTRIYCRSVCPAPTCKRSSVVYYPTAAAAQAAGYRPCLRCRPELAPGPSVDDDPMLRRALALIGSGFLADASVDALARELGLSARHLRRRFMGRLGATPLAVHATQRLHMAKRYLTDTNWPVAQVAAAAGFASLRRFNAAFHEGYRMAPTTMRRQPPTEHDAATTLRLHYRPPYDHAATLDCLARHAVPGLEVVSDGTWWRAFGVNRQPRWFGVSAVPGRSELRLEVFGVPSVEIPALVRRLRRMFDLDADFAAMQHALSADPAMAQCLARRPGLRLPGAWDGFELCLALLLGGDRGLPWAASELGRLVAEQGDVHPCAPPGLGFVFPSAARLATLALEGHGVDALTAQRVRALAVAVRDGALHFSAGQSREVFVDRLCALLAWPAPCAELVALRALGDPDACPLPDAERAPAAAWRPWRAYGWLYSRADDGDALSKRAAPVRRISTPLPRRLLGEPALRKGDPT